MVCVVLAALTLGACGEESGVAPDEVPEASDEPISFPANLRRTFYLASIGGVAVPGVYGTLDCPTGGPTVPREIVEATVNFMEVIADPTVKDTARTTIHSEGQCLGSTIGEINSSLGTYEIEADTVFFEWIGNLNGGPDLFVRDGAWIDGDLNSFNSLVRYLLIDAVATFVVGPTIP